MKRTSWRRAHLSDSPHDPDPYDLSVVICSLKHQIGPSCGVELSILSMLSDQQGSGSPDVEVGDHPFTAPATAPRR
jgi:hypothetical protein